MPDHSSETRLGEVTSAVLESLLESSDSPIFSVDTAYCYTSFNASHAQVMKALYGADIEMGKSSLDYQTVEDDRLAAQANLDRALHGERVIEDAFSGEEARTRRYFTVTHEPIRSNGSVIGVAVRVLDLTERRRAEAALIHSHDLMRYIIEHNRSAVAVHDRDLKYVYVSQRYLHDYGVKEHDVIGKHHYDVFPDLPQKWRDVHQKALAGEISSAEDDPYVREDGTVDWTRWECRPWYEADGSIGGIIVYTEVITERKQAEEHLAAAARQWRQTFDVMRDSVAVFGQDGRVLRCNAATTVLTGRGFDDIVGRPCHEVFHGTHEYHADCPQRRAFESGQVETSFMEEDGRWLRVTFAPEVDAAAQVVGGVHVVTDVSELKQSERQLLQSITKQQSITEGVIAALARTVDVRDPYTAGHQRRVSELAAAIARHMGLDEERVRGVQIAGMLHDIGKIIIPAEILSKPGRLSQMEFELIKEHPQVGFDILETIDFPLPVAEIALQHHERLDGSGYPRGLRGEELLPEARILAVADVIEAMSSHRPYRAALGVEAALAEIKSGSGRLYDAVACEAAIRLFREKGFTFVQ
jgi:PAS domain S-box-containing protein/putative nucleotidyltransferase with HDIG domain